MQKETKIGSFTLENHQELGGYLASQLAALNEPGFSQRMTVFQNRQSAKTLFAQSQT